ncbi:hypothetical protein FXO38_12083 [Capsicum annuum]|nr:hypothetical protein FXO38_12083 [Capsicum annuum]KAF3662963.1 hypothetical protein FXO37_12226 [Capsicum annuum]
MGQNSLSFFPQFACSNMLLMPQAIDGSKLLKPLDNFALIGEQPTLFQKRVVLRKNLENNGGNLGVLGTEIGQSSSNKEVHKVSERKRKFSNSDDLDDLSVAVSTLNSNSNDLVKNSATMVEESTKTSGNSSNTTSIVTTGVDQKGNVVTSIVLSTFKFMLEIDVFYI